MGRKKEWQKERWKKTKAKRKIEWDRKRGKKEREVELEKNRGKEKDRQR
jgi:hypothetical protein